MSCAHVNVVGEIMDQTLGVVCTDCNTALAWCWAENHLPESLWNRAAALDPVNHVPCDENRDNVCALCKEPF